MKKSLLPLLPLLTALALGARAASDPTLDDSATDDIGKYVGAVQFNETAGVRIAPPLEARVMSRAGMDEILSWVQDSRQWVGNVQTLNISKSMSIADYMKAVPDSLANTFRAIQVVDSREVTFQGHKAARMAISMEGNLGAAIGGMDGGAQKIIQLYREQLFVQMSDTQYIVVTQWAPLSDREEMHKTFDAMLSTFEIVDHATILKNRQLAVQAGKVWLSKRTAEELKPKLLTQPQLFRIKIAGKDVGYIQFNESEATVQNMKGIRVAVSSRGFPPGREPVSNDIAAFWAYSKDDSGIDRPDYSLWENTNRTSAVAPAKPGQPAYRQEFWVSELGTLQLEGTSRFSDDEIKQLEQQRDAMIREHPDEPPPPAIEKGDKKYHLRVAISGDPTQPARDNLDLYLLKNDPSFLPRVLDYLWMREVDLTKPSEMTFASFDSIKKHIVIRTLTVKGPDHLVINRKGIDCIKCTDETVDGPNSSATTLWVDSTGKLLEMRTSDQTLLIPTTDTEMVDVWGSKLPPQGTPGNPSSITPNNR